MWNFFRGRLLLKIHLSQQLKIHNRFLDYQILYRLGGISFDYIRHIAAHSLGADVEKNAHMVGVQGEDDLIRTAIGAELARVVSNQRP